MRFYGLSDTHVLQMPVGRFWFLYQTALRIEAQEDLRLLNIAVVTGGMEVNVDGVKSLSKGLSDNIGKVVEFEGLPNPDDLPDPDFRERLRKLATMR
jgi:hypothetical protein